MYFFLRGEVSKLSACLDPWKQPDTRAGWRGLRHSSS
jgi:hypothetical protein